MANPEHLQILKQGVAAWNAWRNQNRGVTPDLGGAFLLGADLGGANLSGANLSGANLNAANLNAADLSGALLRASLNYAALSWAKLSGADLSGAVLTHTDFTGANLSGADVSQVSLLETIFSDTNLIAVQGLKTCIHGGPSTLDHRTLAQSGPLPLAFLRGCGLSDWAIEATRLYQPTLADPELTDVLYRIHHLRSAMPIQYYSCFISYSSVDEAFCRRLHDRMQEAGLRTWFAPEDMRWGQKLHEQLDHAIQHFDKLLLVLTATSMHSPWVEFELRTALAREQREQRRVLFPLRLVDFAAIQAWQCLDADTGKDLAREIRAYYIPGDFSHWQDPAAFEAAFTRLLRDLKAAERPPEG
jgi:uncharacterized protein YjbI with pentapeptide repeats